MIAQARTFSISHGKLFPIRQNKAKTKIHSKPVDGTRRRRCIAANSRRVTQILQFRFVRGLETKIPVPSHVHGRHSRRAHIHVPSAPYLSCLIRFAGLVRIIKRRGMILGCCDLTLWSLVFGWVSGRGCSRMRLDSVGNSSV